MFIEQAKASRSIVKGASLDVMKICIIDLLEVLFHQPVVLVDQKLMKTSNLVGLFSCNIAEFFEMVLLNLARLILHLHPLDLAFCRCLLQPANKVVDLQRDGIVLFSVLLKLEIRLVNAFLRDLIQHMADTANIVPIHAQARVKIPPR